MSPPFARSVSRYFETDHYEETLSPEHALDLIPEIVAKIDEPIADPSLVPTYFLSQVTRKKVTVALGGDGGDELFAGYEWFSAYKLANYYLHVPGILRRWVLEKLTPFLPNNTSYTNPRYLLRRFFHGVAAAPWLRAQVWQGAFMPGLQEGLWVEPPKGLLEPANLFAETRSLFDDFPADLPMDKVMYVSLRQFLLDYILVKVDRCSMLHSLEVRAPFLDRDLVDFAFRLPSLRAAARWQKEVPPQENVQRSPPSCNPQEEETRISYPHGTVAEIRSETARGRDARGRRPSATGSIQPNIRQEHDR